MPAGARLQVLAKRHWPAASIGAVAAVLLLTNLGGDALWEDEGDTAVLARSILRSGVPVAWDGVAFLDPDFGQRLRFGLVMVSHPWLQYYVAAGSFALFGESAAAARLPFALAGVATILVVYAIGVSVLRRRAVGIAAALLLTVSVQFLLFARQARNYPVHALLTCVVIWRFLALRSWRQSAVFAALGIVLFHTHPAGLATLAALGVVTLVSREHAAQRRWFWPAALIVFAYAVPWIVISRAGHAEAATAITGLPDVAWRFAQFFIEYASVTPLIATMLLAGVLSWMRRARALEAHERAFLVACVAVIAAQACLMAFTQTPADIWILGLHHTPALIPLTMLLAAFVVVKVAGRRTAVVVAAVLMLAFTRVGQLVPWVAWSEPVAQPRAAGATFHVPPRLTDRVLRTTQPQFVWSLLRPNPGTIARVAGYLRDHAAPGDIVLTNAESQALYFHTGLPLAAKVSRSFPIYATARAYGLPEYVFGHEGVRWIVWRRAFPAYFAEQDIASLLQEFAVLGIRTELAASFPETIFENRENIHFRRYPGGVYLFPWHDTIPEVRVYRVAWPRGPERWYVEANRRFAAAEYAAAVKEYERFVEVHPNHGEALAKLGLSYLLSQRSGAGIAMLQRALKVAPDNGFAALNLANALFDARRAIEAEPYARRAVTLRASDALAYDVLGRVLAVQGKLHEAIEQFEAALAIDPTAEQSRRNLGLVRDRVGW